MAGMANVPYEKRPKAALIDLLYAQERRITRQDRKLARAEQRAIKAEDQLSPVAAERARMRQQLKLADEIIEHVRVAHLDHWERRKHLEANGWRVEGVQARLPSCQVLISIESAMRTLISEAVELYRVAEPIGDGEEPENARSMRLGTRTGPRINATESGGG
jgi:hypothetical protein